MRRKLKKYVAGGILFAFLLTLVLPAYLYFHTTAVNAAPGDGVAATYGIAVKDGKVDFKSSDIKSAIWNDANSITVTFKNDTTATFFPTNDSDNGRGELADQRIGSKQGNGVINYSSSDIGCYAQIKIDADESDNVVDFIMKEHGSGTIDIDFMPSETSSGCPDGNAPEITFNNPPMSVAYFRWLDSGTIAIADGRATFTRVEGTNVFFKDSEPKGTDCRDKLILNNAKTKVTYYELDNKYTGDPPTSADAAGCKYNESTTVDEQAFPPSNKEILLANSKDMGLPPGTGDKGSILSVAGNEPPSCESSGFSLSWLFCGIVNALAEATDKVHDNMLLPLLKNPRIDTADSTSGTYKAWTSFRNIANIILLFGLLFVVFGQAVGMDAYTAKKMMPRVLVAAILINLSYYLIAIANDITAILGSGIASLIKAPFLLNGDFTFSFSGAASGTVGGLGLAALFGVGALTAGGVGTVGIWGVLGGIGSFLFAFILLPVFLAVLGAAVTLILRRGLLLLLILISPVAFALIAIPGGDKYFKKYRELLFSTLLVYPLFEAIWAISQVLAVTINKANGNSSSLGVSIIGIVGTMIALFAPLFLIPFAFKIAGGVLSTVGAIANDRGKGLIDGRKKAQAEHRSQNAHRFKEGELFKSGTGIGRGINRVGRGAGAGISGRFGFGEHGSAHQSLTSFAAADAAAKDPRMVANKDNDPVNQALTYSSAKEARENLGRDFGMNEAEINRAVAGAEVIGYTPARSIAAARQLVLTNTGYNGFERQNADGTTTTVTAMEQMAQTLARVSEGNTSTGAGMAGFANYYAKQGRADLSPGHGVLNSLVQGGIANGHESHYHVDSNASAAAVVSGSRAVDVTTNVRGKTVALQAIATALESHLETNIDIMNDVTRAPAVRQEAIMEVKRTIGQIQQLDNNKSYGANENQMVINELVARTQQMSDEATKVLAGTRTGAPTDPVEVRYVERTVADPQNPGKGKREIIEVQVPIGQEHLEDIQRFSAPLQQQNNPNNPNNQPPAAPPPPASP